MTSPEQPDAAVDRLAQLAVDWLEARAAGKDTWAIDVDMRRVRDALESERPETAT